MNIPVEYIRTCVSNNMIYFSEHALNRMGERKIKKDIVIKAILDGKPIEEQDHGEDIKILFQESTEAIPEIYVVVAAANPLPVVVTVCITKESAWKYIDGNLKRRKNNYGN